MDRLKNGLSSNKRIPFYCCIIIAGSIVDLPEDYKIDKYSVLNQWFVKIGWFWTTALVLPLMFANVRTNDKQGVATIIFRFILSTFLWYTSTNFFRILDESTGFDISGHTFLLIFSNLLITSESKLTTEEFDSRQHIKILSIILTLLWDFMLVQTALYYHTVLQKMIAALWAIGSWYLLHVLFYEKAIKGSKLSKRNSPEANFNMIQGDQHPSRSESKSGGLITPKKVVKPD